MPKHTQEQWKPIVGYEGRYHISDHGRVKSLSRETWNGHALVKYPERILKASNGTHYPKVDLRDGEKSKRFYVHDLVLTHFVGPKPEGVYARHLDDDSANNHVSNLCWGTPSENSYDKVGNGNDHHAKRNSCVNGHEFTPENTEWRDTGQGWAGTRICLACKRDNARKRYQKSLESKRAWRAKRRAEGKPVT